MANSKYVLGVNGWPNRSHDASACIVRDGELLVAAEEERFTRKKHAYDKSPINAIAWCLDTLGLTIDDISIVATGWDYQKLHAVNKLSVPTRKKILESFLPPHYFTYAKLPKLIAIEHHLAHAASTYYLSGMEEAAIIVADGEGEGEATSFWHGEGGQITRIDSISALNSLGYFYEYASENLGLGRSGAGKTMGLASYGSPNHKIAPIRITDNGYSVLLPDATITHDKELDSQGIVIKAWDDYFNRPRNRASWTYDSHRSQLTQCLKFNQESKDFAASAQHALEEALISSGAALTKKLGTTRLCLAGGVALNCSANSRIAKELAIEELFIPPFPHDGGVSIGAALYASKPRTTRRLASPYLGPKFTSEQIEKALEESGYPYHKTARIEQDVAERLANGKVVGWFMGAMEFGPRALGNRSIIASPINVAMRDRVNNIKNREKWRPFAPSVIEDYIGEYFNEKYKSPYMLQTYSVKNSRTQNIGAVVHIDGTTRAQSVAEEANPKYYKLLQEFKKRTGIPMILNTSFNGSAEPIVCSPKDAIRTFSTHDLDTLAIGDFIIDKVGQ